MVKKSKTNINLKDRLVISFIGALLYALWAIIQPLTHIQETYSLYIMFLVFVRGFSITYIAISIRNVLTE